ncbi:MAG: hypothetical protein ACYS47_00085 [Planctomycetota bacterium]|jgi:hypothetical protein
MRGLTIRFWVSLVTALALALPVFAADEEPKKEEKGGEKVEKKEEKKEEKPELKSHAKAVELFDKAVAWQGRPTSMKGKLVFLSVDKIHFKIWGENDVEGDFQIKHTAPDKVWFKIWTPSWWRNYWTNGGAFFRRTAATKGRCEVMSPKLEDDREGIKLVGEAVRIARLLILENHKTSDVVFEYLERANPKGRKDTPLCHVVKRRPLKDDWKELMYFYLSQDDGHPVCIAVRQFLNIEGVFFIHLFDYRAFKGVQFPTRIEIYVEDKPKKHRKFLFANVILDEEEGHKVRINGFIDDEIYGFQK